MLFSGDEPVGGEEEHNEFFHIPEQVLASIGAIIVISMPGDLQGFCDHCPEASQPGHLQGRLAQS